MERIWRKNELFQLTEEIFNTGELPLDFTKCKIIPIIIKSNCKQI